MQTSLCRLLGSLANPSNPIRAPMDSNSQAQMGSRKISSQARMGSSQALTDNSLLHLPRKVAPLSGTSVAAWVGQGRRVASQAAGATASQNITASACWGSRRGRLQTRRLQIPFQHRPLLRASLLKLVPSCAAFRMSRFLGAEHIPPMKPRAAKVTSSEGPVPSHVFGRLVAASQMENSGKTAQRSTRSVPA